LPSSSAQPRQRLVLLLAALAALTVLAGVAHAVNPAPAKALVAECAEVHCNDGDGGGDDGEPADTIWLDEEVIEIEDTKPSDAPSEDSGTNSGGLMLVGSFGDPRSDCGSDTGYLCLPQECRTPEASAQVAKGNWSCMEPIILLPAAPPGSGFQDCKLGVPDGSPYDTRALKQWGSDLQDCMTQNSVDTVRICHAVRVAIGTLRKQITLARRHFRNLGLPPKKLYAYIDGVNEQLTPWEAIKQENDCGDLSRPGRAISRRISSNRAKRAGGS
jgi:hypothetical protein